MDARLREGIGLFNDGKFFDSHEVLESFYQDTEAVNKPFLEALIQLAAAYRVYRDSGEAKGPVRIIHQALVRLENYRPAFLEVPVKELSEAAEAWTRVAQAQSPAAPAPPKIQLQRFSLFS
jgi:predicted metal-dependent hydrolase